MRITTPAPNANFIITAAAEWPSIPFTTDGSGAHTWNWEIKWGTFRKSGVASTPANTWDASDVVTNFGGTLTVRVTASNQTATVTVTIKGTNPNSADVTSFLATKPNSDGFDKIIQHETHCRHFNASGEPIKSFDNGYGMCQLTSPVPSYEQVWNWKMNVEGGLSLFASKRQTATTYLSQSSRTFTADQLRYETVCRWNGGSYHEWDGAKWVRHSNILCDSQTGNIGWDMTDSENTGKTEAQLHARDKGSYSSPPDANAHWKYSGVCYADSVLG
ncbi:MAG TPA: hypothetical protein VMU05_09645 [Dongiaceae bacterium]|nr:hypothetical protein [Dongiaceae bacterium]